MAKDWRLGVLAIYALIIGSMLIDAQSRFFEYAVFLWCLLPMAILCLIPTRPTELGITAILIALFGVWACLDAVYIGQPDGLALLAFIFLPIAQFVAAPFIFGIGTMITKNFGEQ